MAERGRKTLDVLMRRRNEWVTNCVYCGRVIVNVRLMPQEFLAGRTNDKALLEIRGRRYRVLLATADHYLEMCYGGRSALNNILPACKRCNNSRSVGTEFPRPRICVDCDGPKTGTARRRCVRCCESRLREMEMLAFNPS